MACCHCMVVFLAFAAGSAFEERQRFAVSYVGVARRLDARARNGVVPRLRREGTGARVSRCGATSALARTLADTMSMDVAVALDSVVVGCSRLRHRRGLKQAGVRCVAG